MTSRELLEALAAQQVIDEESTGRADRRASFLVAAYRSWHRNSRVRAEPYSPEDFPIPAKATARTRTARDKMDEAKKLRGYLRQVKPPPQPPKPKTPPET